MCLFLCFSSFTLVLYGSQFHSGRSDHANKNLMKIKKLRSSSLCIFLIPRSSLAPPPSPHLVQIFSTTVFFFRYFPIYDQTKMNNYTVSHRTSGATRSSNCLRQCAKSWKVAGSIRDGVIWIFNWFNPSGRITAPGSTQHITKWVNQPHYSPEVPRGFQEVKIPTLRDNGPGWW